MRTSDGLADTMYRNAPRAYRFNLMHVCGLHIFWDRTLLAYRYYSNINVKASYDKLVFYDVLHCMVFLDLSAI